MQDRQKNWLEAGRELKRKVHDRSARLGVIGLGYVGLPLAVEMARAGFHVTGIDINRERVQAVNAGISYVLDVPSEILLSFVTEGRLRATQSLAVIEDLDTVSICVPTPLRKTKDPDLSYIMAAVEAVHNHLRPGQLIVLESTTYPGTTQEVVLPVLEKTGLRVGKDFRDRIDPPAGNAGLCEVCEPIVHIAFRKYPIQFRDKHLSVGDAITIGSKTAVGFQIGAGEYVT